MRSQVGKPVSETEFVQTAEAAARKAAVVLQSWAKKFTVSEKSRSNLVTEADLAAQQTIHEHIRGRFPEHSFLGEEGLVETNRDSPFRWLIDPLDGTLNYVHHFPYYAVSIALECDGEMIAGVVYDPNRDEMFSAVRGGGATLNGRELHTSTAATLAEAFVVASLPVAVEADDPTVQSFLRVLPKAQTVQRTGSAALNLSYVAAGRIDAYWSASLKPWDMAAGILLVREAGGRVSTMAGRAFNVEVPDLLSSNGTSVHESLQQLLSE